MAISSGYNLESPSKTHTTLEFITAGANSVSNTGYNDFSYIETLNGKYEFVVKNVLEDYMYELKQLAVKVDLTSAQVTKYRYNPKLLAYDLYGSTKLYHFILRLNDMADVHQFSLKSKKIKLLTKSNISSVLSSIYNANKVNIKTYNNLHLDDKTDTTPVPYR